MKSDARKPRAPAWNPGAATPRPKVHKRPTWILEVLYAVALASAVASAGVLHPGSALTLPAAVLGGLALAALVLRWAVWGFSGYEHQIGLRIIRRARPSRASPLPIYVTVAVAVVGFVIMALGLRSALLAVVIAGSSLAAIAMVLARRLAVFATLAIIGIAIGVAALIVVQSVATGFQHEFERRVLGVYAHVNVTKPFGISEYRRFEQYLRTVPGVEGASPFVYYAMALAPVGDEGAPRRASVLVKGIDPETAGEVIDLEEHLEQGSQRPVEIGALTSGVVLQPVPDRADDRLPPVIAETPDPRGEAGYRGAMERWRSLPDHLKYGRGSERWLDDDDAWPEPLDPSAIAETSEEDLPTMFVGVTLARELGLEVDDVVMMVDPGTSFSSDVSPEFRRYRIAGVFRAGFQEYDSRLVYVHIEELQYFKYRGTDKVSGIDLRLRDLYDAPAVETRLRETLGDEYTILEWQKLNENLFQSIRTQKAILTIILSLVGTVAGFNVLAALWTMVVRRTAEIAIVMSMGATESGVARMFQFSGMMLGTFGCVAGVTFGLVLCGLVQLYGYTLDPEVYFIEQLPVEISIVQISAVVVLTLSIAFVATLPPSLRAAKLRPVEGLRYE